MRLRQRRPPLACGRNPPNSSLLNTKSPRACHKVIARTAKMPGIKAFQSPITRKLTAATAKVPNKAIFRILKKRYRFISYASLVSKLLVDGLQSPPQSQHCISLSRQQRVNADAGGFTQFLKASALYFHARQKHRAAPRASLRARRPVPPTTRCAHTRLLVQHLEKGASLPTGAPRRLPLGAQRHSLERPDACCETGR